jgi:DNA polymerase-3 subunit alpha
MSYFSIHNHTEMSNLRLADSTNKTVSIIKYAEKIGLKGLSITDHECLSAHVEAIRTIKEINKNNPDFKLGLGNEIYLVNTLEGVRDQYVSGITKFPHFILIAKSKDGHLALRKMSTLAWLNSFKTGRMERVPLTTQQLVDVMSEHRGQVIASSACLGGYIGIKFDEYSKTGNYKALEEKKQ